MYLVLSLIILFVLAMIALYWNDQCKPERSKRDKDRVA
jgi:hypothetical protein